MLVSLDYIYNSKFQIKKQAGNFLLISVIWIGIYALLERARTILFRASEPKPLPERCSRFGCLPRNVVNYGRGAGTVVLQGGLSGCFGGLIRTADWMLFGDHLTLAFIQHAFCDYQAAGFNITAQFAVGGYFEFGF